MSTAYSQEVAFMKQVATLRCSVQDLQDEQQQQSLWLERIEQVLAAVQIPADGLTQRHPQQHALQQLKSIAQQNIQQWQQAKQDLEPVLALTRWFEDKAILLVFGKFNAGKSSFCNFVAQRFAFHQYSVRHFTLEQGALRFHEGPFQEGSTETTAHIQGVILADKLVLIDTPGLHSVTADNADLTQQFIESADGVLWLTSSTSPGQTQELAELSQELGRGKPLLPIITRSDYLDERVVDNAILKVLCNKSAENRYLQETDVWQRAQDSLRQNELFDDLVQTPLSISVYYARQHEQAERDLQQAGLYRLYDGLLALIEPIMAYQSRKTVTIEQHYLQEQVKPAVALFMQRLDDLQAQLQQEQQAIPELTHEMVTALWQQTMAIMPSLLDRYTDRAHGAELLCQGVQQVLADQLLSYLETHLFMYCLDLEEVFEPPHFVWPTLNLQAEYYEQSYLTLEKGVLEQLEAYARVVSLQVQSNLDQPLLALRQLQASLDTQMVCLA